MPALLKLKLDKIFFRSLTEGTRRYEAFSKAQSDEHIEQGDTYEVEDIFASSLKAKDPETGEGFSLPELVSESSLLIVGGKPLTYYFRRILKSVYHLTYAFKGTIAYLPQWHLLSSIYSTTPPVLPNSLPKFVHPSQV